MLRYISVKTWGVHCAIDQLSKVLSAVGYADMMTSVQHTIFKTRSCVHIKGASVQYLIQL